MSENAVEIIAKDSKLQKIIEKIIELRKKGEKYFEYYEVGIQPHEVSRYIRLLSRLGIIRVYEKTNKATRYTNAIPIEQIEIILKTARQYSKLLTKQKTPTKKKTTHASKPKYPVTIPEDLAVPEEIVNNLFTAIEGLEEQKEVVKTALMSPSPVHLLLIGPPATAKSLFLLDIYENVPGSMYILGSTSSKAGIRDMLLENRPTILLIDEIDKIDPREMDILLSIMESGLLVVTKGHFRATEKMWVKVFAACNDPTRITKALLSRFLPVEFPEYNDEQYKSVVVNVLTQREKVKKEIAELIAEELAKYTRDPRDAVNIGRMLKKVKDVEHAKRLIKILAPSIKKKYQLLKYGRMRY